MATVTVSFSGDAARLQQQHDRLLADQEKIIQKYRSMANISSKSASELRRETALRRAATQAEREAKSERAAAAKIINSTLTPQQRANELSREAIELYQKGHISREVLQRRFKQLKANARAEEEALNTTKQSQELERKAAAIIDRNTTAMERYKLQLREAKEAQRDGRISMEQLRRERKRLSDEFRKNLSPNNQLGDLTKRAIALGAAYIGVGTAVAGVSRAIQDQVQLQEKSLEIAERIAGAQQEAFKNLAGVSPEERQRASEEAKRIARVGIPVDKVLDAIGTAQSAAGQFGLDKAIEAVEASVALNIQKPEFLRIDAASALDVANATGVTDIKANLGLIKSIGAQARPDQARKVAENASKGIMGVVSSLPDELRGKESERRRAAIDAGALFAVFSKAGVDPTGESTSTAAVQFSREIAELFTGLAARREETAADIAKLESAKAVTPEEQVKIDAAKLELQITKERLAELGRIGRKTKDQQQQELQLKIQAREDELQLKRTIEGSTLSDEENKELERLRIAATELRNVADPGRFAERVATIRSNETLRNALFEKEFGEARFKAAMENLFKDGDRFSEMFTEARQSISFDQRLYDNLARETTTATPELQVGAMRARLRADNEAELNSLRAQTIAMIRDQFSEVEVRTRSSSLLEQPFQMAEANIQAGRIASARSVDEAAELARYFISGRIANDARSETWQLGRRGQGSATDEQVDQMQQFLNRLEEIATTFKSSAELQNQAAGNLNGVAGNLKSTQKDAAAGRAAAAVGGDQ